MVMEAEIRYDQAKVSPVTVGARQAVRAHAEHVVLAAAHLQPIRGEHLVT